ncbi:MAG: hypothetical protein J7513_17205 [Solirubrobacteraceae bacterium]|nr:hypothetical protein [Solirubrobacteraceae bacterium]
MRSQSSPSAGTRSSSGSLHGASSFGALQSPSLAAGPSWFSGGPRAAGRHGRRASGIALVAAGLLAALPGNAGAASVSQSGGTLRYSGDAAAESVLLSYDDRPGVVRITVHDAPTALPASCEWEEGYGIYCSLAGVSTVAVDLAGGNDDFTAFSGATTAVVVDGGAGNDRLRSAEEPATFYGGPGDDELLGFDGDDVLDGGDGNDNLEGGEGSDRLSGGAGADKLLPDPTGEVFGDVVDGGAGFDEIELYSSITRSLGLVDLSLDGGGADGFAGENDDIRGVEKITVQSGGTITGTDLPENFAVYGDASEPVVIAGRGGNDVIETYKADDKLDGGAGDDRLVGGFGHDTITGGPGRDTIIGDTDGSYCNEYSCTLPFGNDTIDARDGEADTIDCGVGTDTVYADSVDVVAPNCEAVTLGAAPGGGTPGPGTGGPQAGANAGSAITAKTTKLRTALAKGLKLQLAGLPKGKTKVRAKRGRTLVASGTAKVSAGGTATVRVRFTKAARRALAAKKKVTLTVSAGGKTATVVLTK